MSCNLKLIYWHSMVLLTPTLGGSRDNPKIGHFVDLFSQLADKIKTYSYINLKP